MPTVPRPWNFGIIYAASGTTPLPTYVDIKGVTQSYIALTDIDYTEMTTVTSGGVDTSKPFADAMGALTLSVTAVFDTVTSYRLKLQFRRFDEVSDPNAWKDLQTVSQDDTSVTAAAHTITGAAQTKRLAFQTASILSAGQIRVVAYIAAGESGTGDALVVSGMVA